MSQSTTTNHTTPIGHDLTSQPTTMLPTTQTERIRHKPSPQDVLQTRSDSTQTQLDQIRHKPSHRDVILTHDEQLTATETSRCSW
ncbi:hypothetical protein CISIN_1g034758mg [Citrus sinensis]|uniref:Uncharacterized protein n=1 Tax=Citrus sinensis TaxID=2711 RepID=A0A067D7K2_CITSI|nr:hypothetical protein CISIN_1g034758mg [Citrus sinensis]